MKKLLILLFAFIFCNEIVFAEETFEDVMYQHAGFVWTPLDGLKLVGSTDSKSLEEVYYCNDDTVRNVYYKKFVEEQSALMKDAGLSGILSESDQKCQKALENGNCKLIANIKTLQKKDYKCIGLFDSNNEFLDIQICNTTPETYKQQKAKGISHEQMESFFNRNEKKLIQEFKDGKAK
ncbi:hypothetical protein J6A31_01855 [bacterium]|nr:hypothetical protein [bacterium]